MEKVISKEATKINIIHEFYCDKCNKYLGESVEYDDGWFDEIGYFDTTIINFLNKNGFDLKQPISKDKLEIVSEKLKSEGKFLDTISYVDIPEDYGKDGSYKVKHYIIPFFNSISNPLSEENKEFIIEGWKKKRKKK